MGLLRDEIALDLFHGVDPFLGFSPSSELIDQQGWASSHPYLAEAIRQVPDRSVVVEIGVWKGGSVITMGKELKRLGRDQAIIAVDTWLGSHEHWVDPELFRSLRTHMGRPSLQSTFMANIANNRLEDWVVPLPLDSVNASRVVAEMEAKISLLHVDAGHDYVSVSADLAAWYPLLQPGGVLLCDDYYDGGVWPEVRRAVDAFVSNNGLSIRQYGDGKCWIEKPIH